MTEAVQLLLALVLSSSHHLKIDAFTDVENAASQRVLKKCGFRNVGSIVNAVNHPQRGWRDQYHFTLISDGK
jgi:RimJ/RimL family protein N-acetyltransferase